MAHIPWLFTYLRLFPVIKIRQRMFDLVGTYVNRRLVEGSNTKDLMYYLVSYVFCSSLLIIGFLCRWTF